MNQVEEKKYITIFFIAYKGNICELIQKTKILNLKNLVDKMHKITVKELKFNVNHHIKTCKNHNLVQV